MRIKQRIPGYVSGIEPKEEEFSNVMELLKIDFIQSLIKIYGDAKFLISSKNSETPMLMARVKNKEFDIPVGYLFGDISELPFEEWKGHRKDEEKV